jgi:N-carbamoyl-L-amino-acid hydrolase
MRDLDAEVLASMLAEARAASERFAAEEGCTVESSKIWSIEPISFDSRLIEICDEAVREVAGASHRLPSGPLHDAAEVARTGVPTVMMFTQSLAGLSHNKAEDTRIDDLKMAVEAFDRLARKTVNWLSAEKAKG